MSEKPAVDKPTRTGTASGAESPTTARELDFDDDNETPASAHENVASPPPPSKSPKPGVRFTDDATEIPPPKPPRPADALQEKENQLADMFKGQIDRKVVRAVLVASGGQQDKAMEALLTMSDPDYVPDEAPPPQPPRPATQRTESEERDYQFALSLQQEEQRHAQRQGHSQRTRGAPLQPQPDPENRDHSFFDDDLPVIRKNIEEGFRETQKGINKWIGDFIKKIDGDDKDTEEQYDRYGNPVPTSSQRRQNFGPSQSDQLYGIRKSAESRRSADRERYDTDNRVIGDDFERLELRDDENPPPKPNRPLANPDLFKPTPVAPPQSGPVDEVDALYRNPSPNNQNSQNKSGGKKWQPLTSVAPHPEQDDHDPFSLGDSDEEEAKTKDIKAEDTERLKKAASENKDSPTSPELKENERSGSVGQIDAAAEALLKDTK